MDTLLEAESSNSRRFPVIYEVCEVVSRGWVTSAMGGIAEVEWLELDANIFEEDKAELLVSLP
jgi:hypothetical protein